MAEIMINDSRVVKGALSVRRFLDTSGEKPMLVVMGQLETHLYFEEIKKIESERLILEDVFVFEESFGSKDHEIIYSFTAASLELTGGESHLNSKEIADLEKRLYGGDQ